MKTNGTLEAPAATSQPGNVTVRQLAASLRKTPATAKEENGGGHRPAAASATESTAETHEAPPPEEGETQADENLEQEHTEGAETEAAAETTDAAPETESTEATDSTEETAETESAENAEPALSEAMAARIDAELAPLIDELTKAGAKGALQILQKRIPKLVDQRDTERNGRLSAEQQVSQLRQELQDAKSGGGSRNEGRGSSEFAHPAVAAVAEELGNVDHWLGWCEDNAEGGEVPDGKGGKAELDAAQVRQLRLKLNNERTEIVARKVQTEREVKTAYDREFAQHHTAALTHYPALKNPNSKEAQELKVVLQYFPQLKASPDHELAIADMMAGRNLRLAKGKASATAVPRKPAPQREPTRVVAEPPTSSAARKAPEKAKKDEADAQFQKTGRMSDLAKTFAASRRASRTGN